MDDTECLICLEEFDTSSVAVLSCNHRYHYNCLTKWIKKSNKTYKICSICNSDVEIVNIIDNNSNSNIERQYEETDNLNNKEKRKYNCCNIL